MKNMTILSFLIISFISYGFLPTDAAAQSRTGTSNYFSYTYEVSKEGVDIEARSEGAVELLFVKISNSAGTIVYMNKFTIDGRSSTISIDLSGVPVGIYTLNAKSRSINFSDDFKKY